MRIRLACLGALSIAVLLGLISMPNVAAQEKAQKAQKADKADKTEKKGEKANVQGTVQNMSKDTSTITVRTGTGQVTRQVMYDGKTKFLYGHSDNNKPGAVAQVKESNYISCVGTYNDKSQLMATECVYRESK
jgi:hypothetical protein